jgi:hypothetical protein
LAFDAFAVLADDVAEQVRLGRVLGERVAHIVELLDDVVLQLVPIVVDDRHR